MALGTREEQIGAWLNLVVGREESIKSEEDVNKCLWFSYPTSPLADQTPSPTGLLPILGYGLDNVSYKKNIPLARGRGLEPDFVLRVNGEDVLVIEDKAPSVSIDGWIGQTCDYFLKVDAPLAMIFNTREAMLLINTRLPELCEFEEPEFKPVLRASMDNRSQMQKLLNYLAAPSSRSDMLVIARSLAEKRVAEIERVKARELKAENKREQLKTIADRVAEIKSVPPDYLLTAIIANDEKIKQIRRVKPGDVMDAWLGRIAQPMPSGEIEVRGEHNKIVFEARFNQSTGNIMYDGEPCKPSPAALNAIHTVDPKCKSINGWMWWEYYDNEKKDWLPITTLRAPLDKQG
ncbi:MAG: hypothetical protein NT018_07770 [Armatimonadetes bacterium]|nr:hypothetical protein [Armatimonadota bacterium]